MAQLAVFDHIKTTLAFNPVMRRVGRISSVSGGILKVTQLSDIAGLGDRVVIAGLPALQDGGEIVEIDEATVSVLPENPSHRVSLGQEVFHVGPLQIAPSDDWIGRVIDPMGRPLDGRPIRLGGAPRTLVSKPQNPADRRGMGSRLSTGLALFDTLLPIARGQRLGLFAGSGVGKSTMLARLALGIESDVVVVALIGERGREVQEFVKNVLGAEGMRKAVVVASTADNSPLLRRRCAETALSVAEHFRDQGKHVLLLADSLTRYAEAHREIALSTGESASMRGYPPSLAQLLMSLAERAGTGSNAQADITAIFTVLVAGSDMEEPVADILRGVLDGHVVMDRGIAERGRFPAVDVSKSVSRSLPDIATEEENQVISSARRILGTYEKSELMIRAGLYTTGTDPELDRAIEVWPKLDEFFTLRGHSLEEHYEKLVDILRAPTPDQETEGDAQPS